jgi:hypothetical protein
MTPLVIRMMIVGPSGVIRMMIIGDKTTWAVILTIIQSSFTIVICLIYRPQFIGPIHKLRRESSVLNTEPGANVIKLFFRYLQIFVLS